MGKHIPGNPTIVPKNMEGAGSLRLANWLYNVAPKDGTAIGTIGRGTAFDPLLGSKGAQFEADKFTWIGSANNEVSICVAWKTSGITKFEDMLTKELIVGGTGQAADTDQFPRILNGVLGTKFKIVTGYPGGNDVGLAMERGEVKGRCGWSWSSVHRHAQALDRRQDDHHPGAARAQQASRPAERSADHGFRQDRGAAADLQADLRAPGDGAAVLAPPGVPPDRAEALRKAFMDTMKDKEFLADAEKAQLEIKPVSGAEVEQLVKDIYADAEGARDKAPNSSGIRS